MRHWHVQQKGHASPMVSNYFTLFPHNMSLSCLWFYWKKLRVLRALEDLEPLFKIFYTFVCKKFVGKITDKYMENLNQASGGIQGQVHVCPPPPIFYDNPLLFSFSLQLIFFSEKPFYGNYSTLDSHTSTVTSHTFAYSSRWCRKPWQGLLHWWPKAVSREEPSLSGIYVI